jgi:hypothetical protein
MIEPIWRGRLAIGDVVIPLRRNDPFVALAVAGLTVRRRLRTHIGHFIRTLRAFKEKRQ